MQEKQIKQFLKIVKKALKEDIGRGDITTDLIVDQNEQALGTIFPKQDGILCGIEIAQMIFKELDEKIDFQIKLNDGDNFSPGMTIATIIGPASVCLKGERTALNFLQHLSGIATLTRKFVDTTKGSVKILDTRKTVPGLRIMEKYAVRTGGGHNHRFGLYDMVLIKNNHIEIAGSITKAVAKVRKRRKKAFVEVEIKTFEELNKALSLKINRVMLDNMNVNQIKRAVEIIRQANPDMEIELSGSMNLSNIKEFSECGVDFISVGALTHSAPAIDIAMKLKPLGQCEP
ncbi:carboxylating nicotinate-nucleotide diphosphorylase [candidate division WOR-3 bacterium]|nr:carboxylating nicotinate-nucleotide diphosphorylase [candidate division WOR-3 bacterium]